MSGAWEDDEDISRLTAKLQQQPVFESIFEENKDGSLRSNNNNNSNGAQHCPLCMEELDATERNFKPCRCGYQMCLWCWHSVRERLGDKCPACRQPYDESNIQFTAPDPATLSQDMKRNKKRGKTHITNEVEKNTNESNPQNPATNNNSRLCKKDVRVLQRNLLYVVGLPSSLADEDVLKEKQWFGRWGDILDIKVNDSSRINANGQKEARFSAYITYHRAEDAAVAMKMAHGSTLRGKVLRCSYGTTKYCAAFRRGVPCTKTMCLFLHEEADPNDCVSLEELRTRFSGLPAGPSHPFGEEPYVNEASEEQENENNSTNPDITETIDNEEENDDSTWNKNDDKSASFTANGAWQKGIPVHLQDTQKADADLAQSEPTTEWPTLGNNNDSNNVDWKPVEEESDNQGQHGPPPGFERIVNDLESNVESSNTETLKNPQPISPPGFTSLFSQPQPIISSQPNINISYPTPPGLAPIGSGVINQPLINPFDQWYLPNPVARLRLDEEDGRNNEEQLQQQHQQNNNNNNNLENNDNDSNEIILANSLWSNELVTPPNHIKQQHNHQQHLMMDTNNSRNMVRHPTNPMMQRIHVPPSTSIRNKQRTNILVKESKNINSKPRRTKVGRRPQGGTNNSRRRRGAKV